MSQPFQLFRLQQIDSQIDQGRNRLRGIETELNNHAAMQQAQQYLQENEANLALADKNLRKAEENVQAQRIKIENTESTLYGGKVRNPKELQDLQLESAALKRYLETLEERQLEAIIAFEDLEKIAQDAVQKLDHLRREKNQNDQILLSEQAGLIIEIKQLEGERAAAARPISPVDLSLYEKLRQTRRGVAVARATGNVCTACGAALSAALSPAVRSPNQLNRCDSCGRILYTG
jgi:hypothetical protein